MKETMGQKIKNIQKQINRLKDARCIVNDVGQDTKTLDAVIVAMGRVLEYLCSDDEGRL